jgi:hypothetical protein
MALEQIFAELEAAVADGIIERYAIGGAVGATFYIEPSATEDVDVFVVFREAPTALLTLTPIYAYFTRRGAIIQDEHLVIAGWPVQFLPAPSELVDEALAYAVRMSVDGQGVFVISQEHLAAISLEAGRMKDKFRLTEFLSSASFGRARFDALVDRFGLRTKWANFQAMTREER